MRTDVLLGLNNDLSIISGDFAVGTSDAQHVKHLVAIPQGAWKQAPLTGYGEAKLIAATFGNENKRAIQLQLDADGYRANNVTLSASGLEIKYDA
jgi:hypothetical protein